MAQLSWEASCSTQGGGAFIWDPQNSVRKLQDLLIDEFGLDLAGWQLGNAMSVSADGRTIVGDGFNPSGNPEAGIAVIPDPSTALLLATGLGVLGVGRRR